MALEKRSWEGQERPWFLGEKGEKRGRAKKRLRAVLVPRLLGSREEQEERSFTSAFPSNLVPINLVPSFSPFLAIETLENSPLLFPLLLFPRTPGPSLPLLPFLVPALP
ncbi:hypothetical protein BOO34_18000 [Vibrio navarrensis]|nr:hypothetical protein [Vibrio navarrensis]